MKEVVIIDSCCRDMEYVRTSRVQSKCSLTLRPLRMMALF